MRAQPIAQGDMVPKVLITEAKLRSMPAGRSFGLTQELLKGTRLLAGKARQRLTSRVSALD